MEPEIDDSFRILFEDNEIVVVDKSGNCPVHEGGLYKENCLTRMLEKKFGRLLPCYRIDRETSGIVVFGKRKVCKVEDKEYVGIPEVLVYPFLEYGGDGLVGVYQVWELVYHKDHSVL